MLQQIKGRRFQKASASTESCQKVPEHPEHLISWRSARLPTPKHQAKHATTHEQYTHTLGKGRSRPGLEAAGEGSKLPGPRPRRQTTLPVTPLAEPARPVLRKSNPDAGVLTGLRREFQISNMRIPCARREILIVRASGSPGYTRPVPNEHGH